MRKLILCAFIIIAFASCVRKVTVVEKNITPEEKWEIIREYFMAPGASAGGERPLPNVLSEREVLLKAADFALEKGMLDPSHPVYQNHPVLLTAKIETPILVTNAGNGEPDNYLLTAVDDDGVLLADVGVNSALNANVEEFKFGRGFARPVMRRWVCFLYLQTHFPLL